MRKLPAPETIEGCEHECYWVLHKGMKFSLGESLNRLIEKADDFCDFLSRSHQLAVICGVNVYVPSFRHLIIHLGGSHGNQAEM